MAGREVTDHDRAEVARLHATGAGRNEIARTLKLAAATITKLAQQQGLSFDRAPTAQATEARKTEAAGRRAELELAYLAEARMLIEELRAPVLVYNFGGKDNSYEEQLHDEPDAASKLKLMQASGIAVDRALKLADTDASTGLPAAKSMLGALAAGLRVAQEQLVGTEVDTPDPQ
jgi:hypothetical protein